jgi:hypothetical protein
MSNKNTRGGSQVDIHPFPVARRVLVVELESEPAAKKRVIDRQL